MTTTISDDARFDRAMMHRALVLARRGQGLVSPNPMVGAVLVRGGVIIATGYHHRHGAPHAEIEALSKIGFKADDCTLYVNLEPCCHHGLTPPCAGSVVSSGVRRVVIGMVDPNPLVSGRGVETLRAGGLDVTVGVMADESAELNRAFIKWISTGRPWVTLKMAATLDGRIADRSGSSRWITGPAARKDVHRMRAACDCVMVGGKTAQEDDPLLLPVMFRANKTPIRAVVSGSAALSVDSRLVASADSGKIIMVTSQDAPRDRLEDLRRASVEILSVETVDGRLNLEAMLDELGARRVTSVLVEGGATLAASLLKGGLVDRVVLYYSPMLLADPVAPGWSGDLGFRNLAEAVRFKLLSVRRIETDVRLDLEPVR